MYRATSLSVRKRVRWGGLLGAIAGAVFVPYALSKGYLTSVIIGEGWHLAGLSSIQTAKLFHAFEAVPLALMVVGLISLHARTAVRGALAEAGISVALAGFMLTMLAHLGEHLLAPITVPALTGGENWFLWVYYLSWLTLYAGFTLYGVALRTSDFPGWLPWLFMFTLPVTVVVGFGVSTLGVFTLAGTFRLVQGLVWVPVGRWLWIDPTSSPFDHQSDIVTSHGTDDH